MPRRRRSYLPGGAFHITARTHCREFWFADIRAEILEIIENALKQTDAWLISVCVMTNHFHLVVQQGREPLWRLMHPVCQRTAYAVHRRLKRTGYVMGYRYHDEPCRDEAHLRNAIVYTHRNPVEAGLCSDPAEYAWSSDRAYRMESCSFMRGLIPASALFSSGLPDRAPQQDYADFYAWYDACKQLPSDAPRPHSPGVTAGDIFWLDNFALQRAEPLRPEGALRDLVRKTLAEVAPNLSIDLLRSNMRGKSLIAVRDTIIERALEARFRPVDIARYLNVSDTTVSRVRVSMANRLAGLAAPSSEPA